MDKQNVKGITLIALVITIIVLLILAGVSIAMLTGPKGLLTQTKDAKIKTEEAGTKEKVQIAVAGSWGENGFDVEKFETEVGRFGGVITPGEEEFPIKVTVSGQNFEVSKEGVVTEKGTNTQTTPNPSFENTIKPGEKVTEEKGNTEYRNNGTAIIPVGFSIVPGLDDVSQGLVISDDDGNEFVWIPVEKEEDYKTNTAYASTNISQNTENDTGYLPTFSEEEKEPAGSTDADKEKNLVISKGGFYISRYEAGDGLATSLTYRTDGSGTTGIVVSKKDAYIYNYISQEDAKAKAKTFINDKNVKSALASGVQWDMVMAFITREPPRKDGNGEDDYIVTSGKSTRHHSTGVEQCGQNEADRVCNIYDLEGNSREYVAEKNTYNTSIPSSNRGGNYNDLDSASYRYGNDGGAYRSYSFRFVLYVI